jgi:succinate-semialdehyde dehydrogenase
MNVAPGVTAGREEFAISLNPTSGREFARYPFETPEQMEESLSFAAIGFKLWKGTPLQARVGVLRRIVAVLRSKSSQMSLMAADEMGKPVQQGRAEVEKCALVCEWYAEHGASMLANEVTTIGEEAYVSYLPLGPILAVMPWNFPFWQVMRGAVPILVGGNVYVLKHAPNVMGCAYQLLEAWRLAGLPEVVFTVLNVTPRLVSAAIKDDRIAAVTVTGGTRAGSAIASQAGAALMKSVLELGGSDPFIVLIDADLNVAAEAAVVGRYQNTGQVCIAAKRIIVEEPVVRAFT